MKKCKIGLLLFSLLITTGCSAKYDLYLDENIIENIYLYDDIKTLEELDYYDMNKGNEVYIDAYVEQVARFENKFDYKREEIRINENKDYGYKYSNSYKLKKYRDLSMVANCYDNIDISIDDNISLETSDEFKCFDKYSLLDEVTVNIYYSGNVINTNASKKDNNVYTWEINKENYQNSKIYFEAEKSKIKIISTFQAVGLVVFVLLIGITYFLYRKKNSGKV